MWDFASDTKLNRTKWIAEKSDLPWPLRVHTDIKWSTMDDVEFVDFLQILKADKLTFVC